MLTSHLFTHLSPKYHSWSLCSSFKIKALRQRVSLRSPWGVLSAATLIITVCVCVRAETRLNTKTITHTELSLSLSAAGDGDSRWSVHYTTQKPQQGLLFTPGKRRSGSADDLQGQRNSICETHTPCFYSQTERSACRTSAEFTSGSK